MYIFYTNYYGNFSWIWYNAHNNFKVIFSSVLIYLFKFVRLKPFSWKLKGANSIACIFKYGDIRVETFVKTIRNWNKNCWQKLTKWNVKFRRFWEERTTTPKLGSFPSQPETRYQYVISWLVFHTSHQKITGQ